MDRCFARGEGILASQGMHILNSRLYSDKTKHSEIHNHCTLIFFANSWSNGRTSTIERLCPKETGTPL